jgi:hypothetical protein
MHANLQQNPNRMIATIDMKSKTTAAKHRTDQGFGFGLRGMSIQGAMLERWRKPTDGGSAYREVSYVDIVYCQSSKQSLEEAMSGVDLMMSFIQQNYPDIDEVQVISDKCSNFNSYEQIPFIVEGNSRGWAHATNQRDCSGEPIPSDNTFSNLRLTEWTFSEAQRGKDQLDCHFSYVKKVITIFSYSLMSSLASFSARPSSSF